ncbi:hypothetical protein JZ751_001741 [Albula glossodonta]|uniref:Uncharacterized protein n=1 Tax=Albula glossodonta TaxID=121402 RepID=A0A8T2PUS8_9TELE|nr:hypothetical protein JZ751_001741 [Albula glossodonta]
MMLWRAALARARASLLPREFPRSTESLSLPWSSWMSKGKQPDWRMAMQLSWELDMASRVRDMSSLSWVPSMDRREYTISTWEPTLSLPPFAIPLLGKEPAATGLLSPDRPDEEPSRLL